MADAAIIAFLRLPVPGQVKTRLAVSIGPEAACSFYKLCAEHILQACAMVPGCQIIAQHSCRDASNDVECWLANLGLQVQPSVLPQSTDPDLGAKLQDALMQQLQQSTIRKALVIGTDIPDLSPQILSDALTALDKYEMVIGPAADGGYYLLGLTQPTPQLFPKDMPWSTSEVLARTVEIARCSGVNLAPVHTLPTLQDIDTLPDLRAWLESTPDETVALNHASPDPDVLLHDSRRALLSLVRTLVKIS